MKPWQKTCLFGKVLRLVELGIGTLICGAISRSMYELVKRLRDSGVSVCCW